jgi:hypothetical protein
MVAASRSSRGKETRNAESRTAEKREVHKAHWKSKLDIPKHVIPKGMTYSWVRVATLNQPDGSNWQSKMNSGWRPVPRDRHPDLFPSIPIPGVQTNDTVINVGDLILCEMSTRDVLAAKRERERDTIEQVQSIQWALDGQQAAPTFNESSRVEVEQVVAEFQGDEE